MNRTSKRSAVVAIAAAAAVLVGLPAVAYFTLTSNEDTAAVTANALGTPATSGLTVSASSVSFTVAAPPTGPAPTAYQVNRTAPAPVVQNVCSVPAAGGTCTDASPVAGQTNTYAVFARLGTNWASLTPATVNAAVPAVATPTVGLTFPTANLYNAAAWTAGCGTAATDDLCGTSTNAASVTVSVRLGSGNYWSNGTNSFSSASEVMLPTTGTAASWTLAFAGTRFTSGTAYTIRAVAGTATTSKTFTWDSTAPTAQNAVSANGTGTAGKIEAGDSLTLTYSEAIDPASLVAGWNGSAMNIVVRGTNNAASNGNRDLLTFFNAANTTQLPLGSVDLDATGFFTGDVTYGATGTAATMTLSSGTLTITLGTVSDATKLGTLSAANQKSKLSWTPSATAKDLAGNACATTAFQGANNTQF